MSKLLVFTILIFWVLSSNAQDTLTRREVYNFEVGDTFDYKYSRHYTYMGLNDFSFSRVVISSKSLSSGGDSLIYNNGALVYTDLDSVEVLIHIPADTNCIPLLRFRDTLPQTKIPLNGIDINCPDGGGSQTFGKGLGLTFYQNGYDDGTPMGATNTSELVYFSKGGMKWGTPYYELDGSKLVKYVPLPEECAVWTRTVSICQNCIELQEQIRTGAKMQLHGRTVVELICRAYYYTPKLFYPDSVIGYFYNDTACRCAVFSSDTSFTHYSFFYETGMLNGTQCATNTYYNISTTQVGNEERTVWSCQSSPYFNYGFISGVGGLSGLIRVHDYYMGGYEWSGQLSCFSICGETLYPKNANTACPLLTALDELALPIRFSIYPNPASNSVSISMEEPGKKTYTVMQIDGRIIANGVFETTTTEITTAKYAAGVYFISIVNSDGTAETKKLIVEH